MFVSLEDFISAYRLPSGRALFAGRKVAAVAKELDAAPITTRADAFLAAANAVHDLELRYRLSKRLPQYSAAATTLDARLDKALGALQRMVSGYLELADDATADPKVVNAAQNLASEMFPRGLTHVTMMSFPEELEAVSKLLVRLRPDGDLAAAVTQLSLQPFVASLDALTGDFRTELDKTPEVEGPSWDQIRAARAQAHARLIELIAVTLGTFPGTDEDSASKRTAILEPIVVQQRALAALYRTRTGGRDVDPDTGEVDPETPEEPVMPPVS